MGNARQDFCSADSLCALGRVSESYILTVVA
jgi:hypothetical protein